MKTNFPEDKMAQQTWLDLCLAQLSPNLLFFFQETLNTVLFLHRDGLSLYKALCQKVRL